MRDDIYLNFYDPTEKFFKEPRAFCYDLALELIGKAKNEVSRIHDWYTHEKTVQAILLILFCWNFAARRTKQLKIKDVYDLLQRNQEELKELEKYSLLTIDGVCEDTIYNVFKDFLAVLKQTGASKALSLLNPKLFVMWDTKIRYELRKVIKNLDNGERPENYVNYLYGMKEIAVKYNLQSKLPKGVALAKKIDEYHFVEFVFKK